MNDDRITLLGLEAHGHHGLFREERLDGQKFILDVELTLDLSVAAVSDDISETVNYGELADRLVEIVEGEPVNLIETLAARLLQVCLADLRVAAAVVTVHKPQAPIRHMFHDVAVTMRRNRSWHPEPYSESDRESHQEGKAR